MRKKKRATVIAYFKSDDILGIKAQELMIEQFAQRHNLKIIKRIKNYKNQISLEEIKAIIKDKQPNYLVLKNLRRISSDSVQVNKFLDFFIQKNIKTKIILVSDAEIIGPTLMSKILEIIAEYHTTRGKYDAMGGVWCDFDYMLLSCS